MFIMQDLVSLDNLKVRILHLERQASLEKFLQYKYWSWTGSNDHLKISHIVILFFEKPYTEEVDFIYRST